MPTNNISPTVSIIIPVYNGSDYLKEAVDSAIRQTYPDTEIIIINDGSDDGEKTELIALGYGNRVHYLKKENGGVSSALNLGIQNSSGEYLSWLSHDDMYSDQKIAHAIAWHQNHDDSEKVIVFSGGTYINEKSELIKPFPKRFESGRIYSGTEVISEMISHGTLNGCCMLIPRSAFEKCGLFEEELRYSQDTLMWYRIFSSGYSLVYIEEDDVQNRLHRNQVTHTRRELFYTDARRVAELVADDLIRISTSEQNLYLRFTCRNARNQCTETVRYLVNHPGAKQLLARKRFRIWCYGAAGALRSIVKKAYYRLVLRIK